MEFNWKKHSVLHIFDELEPEEIARLVPLHLKARGVLIQEGAWEPANLYMILEGICVNNLIRQSTESIFLARKVLPGDFVGLLGIISDKKVPRPTTVYAKTPVLALIIPGDELLSWQTRHPKIYNKIICNVLSRHLDERMLNVNCAANDSHMAAAYYLLYLYKSYAKGCYLNGYDGPVTILDTKGEIGLAMARNVRTVDRIISDFIKKGFVDVVKAKIIISKDQADLLEEYLILKQ